MWPVRILVRGSAGHLGEALVRKLGDQGHHVAGLDIEPSPWTTHVASVTDRTLLQQALVGIDAVVHTAALHKSVKRQCVRIACGVEESAAAGVGRVVFSSSTTTFDGAMTPPAGGPASWITESVVPETRIFSA
ncbi:MAG: NAD(P)-dependent oxidoreductase [Rhodococcus sp. (in: high G+C Gram-positive bacteria)]